jgi:hypothetical protein
LELPLPDPSAAADRRPVALYDEQVDTSIDGVEQSRPETHFFKSESRRLPSESQPGPAER